MLLPCEGCDLFVRNLGWGVTPGEGQLGLCPGRRNSNVSSLTQGHLQCQSRQSVHSFSYSSVTVYQMPPFARHWARF